MRISVFITSYNQKAYLAEAIESVLAQTLRPHQVIIADDCSTDGSRGLIEGYAARCPGLVTPIFHERNTGVARVRIDALSAVTGDYVTYVDGDDRFLPAKLEKEAAALRREPSAGIAFSNNYYMTADGVRTGVWADKEKPPQGYVFKETFARAFPRGNLFRMELVDYAAWKRVGFHDPGLSIYEDYDMRVRLTKSLRTVYHDEPLSEIREHGKGLSKAGAAVHYEALDYIYEKNRALLADLPPGERTEVEKRLGRFIAPFAARAAIDSLYRLRPGKAARYCRRYISYSRAS